MASDETLEKKVEGAGDKEPEGAASEPAGEIKEGKGLEAKEETEKGGEGEMEEDQENEGEEKGEGGEERGGGGKRGRGKKRGRPKMDSTPKKKVAKDEEAGEKTPTTNKKTKFVVESVERPSRERKTVERYSAISPKKSSTPKVVAIQQGAGTQLKDIPNVLFKLNKRKTDENLQLLHAILFGKKGKTRIVKKNIFQFSGFVWTDEEKQRAKIRERLDKLAKDKLLDFCDVLDLSSIKSTMRKEELSAKLFEFLESPYVTRDVLLSEKKSKKRKKRQTPSRSSGKKVKRERKPKSQSVEGKEEENDVEAEKDGSSGADDDADGHKYNSEPDAEVESAEESEPDNEDEKPPSPVKKASAEKKPKKGKSKEIEKTPVKADSSVKSTKAARPKLDSPKDTPKRAPKTPKEKPASKKISLKSGSASVVKSKNGANKKPNAQGSSRGKKQDKTQASTPVKSPSKGKADAQPTREEIHAVVSDILKEVDFNTATLADILKQLGAHFKTDLISRKSEIKSIIEDVINSMSTDDDEGDEDGDDAKAEDEGQEKEDDVSKGDDA